MATFIGLPLEMKLEIFGYLPASNIQRLRRVCQNFRKAIDSSLLPKEICAREAARITADVKYVVDYDTSKVTFLEALRRWCEHRPSSMEGLARMHDRTDFGHLYHMKKSTEDGSLQDLADAFETHLHHPLLLQHHPLFGMFGVLAERLTDLHAYLYGPFDVEVDKWLFASRSNFARREIWNAYGVDNSWASSMYELLADAPVFKGEWRDQDQHVKAFESCLPLSTLKSDQFYCGSRRGGFYADARDRGRGVCAMSDLVRMFDVPALPSEGHCAGIVAYCVKTKWARDAVENSHLRELKPLEKAAIMEEMFLF